MPETPPPRLNRRIPPKDDPEKALEDLIVNDREGRKVPVGELPAGADAEDCRVAINALIRHLRGERAD